MVLRDELRRKERAEGGVFDPLRSRNGAPHRLRKTCAIVALRFTNVFDVEIILDKGARLMEQILTSNNYTLATFEDWMKALDKIYGWRNARRTVLSMWCRTNSDASKAAEAVRKAHYDGIIQSTVKVISWTVATTNGLLQCQYDCSGSSARLARRYGHLHARLASARVAVAGIVGEVTQGGT